MVFVIAVSGCDRDSTPETSDKPGVLAEQHAELQARDHADYTLVMVRDMVLLAPDSERRKRAREQLLEFDEYRDDVRRLEDADVPTELFEQPSGDRNETLDLFDTPNDSAIRVPDQENPP